MARRKVPEKAIKVAAERTTGDDFKVAARNLPGKVRDSWAPARFEPLFKRGRKTDAFYRSIQKHLDSETLYDLGPTIALMDAVTQRLLSMADAEEGPDFRNRAAAMCGKYRSLLEGSEKEQARAPAQLDKLQDFLEAGHESIKAQLRAVDVAERRSQRTEAARRLEATEQQTISYKDCMAFVADCYAVIKAECREDTKMATRIIKAVSRIAAARAGVVVGETVRSPDEARDALRMVELEEEIERKGEDA